MQKTVYEREKRSACDPPSAALAHLGKSQGVTIVRVQSSKQKSI